MNTQDYSPILLDAAEFKRLMLVNNIGKSELVKSGWFEEYEIANCIERRQARKPSKALQRLFGFYAQLQGWITAEV